jgi:hypothetical protein
MIFKFFPMKILKTVILKISKDNLENDNFDYFQVFSNENTKNSKFKNLEREGQY